MTQDFDIHPCSIFNSDRHMALKTFVKISDVSNLSDARYCAGMGVDMLGFRLDPDDPQSVNPEKFAQIAEWVAGVTFAGEFYQSDSDVIIETIKNYDLDYIQINPLDFTRDIISLKIPIIIEFQLNNHSSYEGFRDFMERSVHDVAYFLFTAPSDAIAQKNMDIVLRLAADFPVLLGCGVHAHNVTGIAENSPVKGIALKGGAEIKPGFKDYDELAEILEAIEVE